MEVRCDCFMQPRGYRRLGGCGGGKVWVTRQNVDTDRKSTTTQSTLALPKISDTKSTTDTEIRRHKVDNRHQIYETQSRLPDQILTKNFNKESVYREELGESAR